MDKTVAKAFRLLEALVRAPRPCGVTELAVQFDLPKSNVHRLLNSMVELGYVRRLEAGLYEPRLLLWELGERVRARYNVAQVARPQMQGLSEACGELVQLTCLEQDEVIYLDKIDSVNPVRAHTEAGSRSPAHCTAAGKVLLADLDDAFLAGIAARAIAYTPATIVDLDALRAELATVRRQGFATNIGEFRKDVAALAAPIRNARGDVIAAIGISGPLDRLRPRKLRSLSGIVVEAAQSISRELGAR